MRVIVLAVLDLFPIPKVIVRIAKDGPFRLVGLGVTYGFEKLCCLDEL